MEIRKTTQSDDFDAISSIYALSWKAAYKGIVPQQYLNELERTHWSEAIRSGMWSNLVLLDGGEYIGASAICPARDEAMCGWGEIVSLYLLPDFWGRGWGKSLFDAAVSELIKPGYNKMYLWVLEDNGRARAFYERNGFKATPDKIKINVGGKDLIEVRYILAH